MARKMDAWIPATRGDHLGRCVGAEDKWCPGIGVELYPGPSTLRRKHRGGHHVGADDATGRREGGHGAEERPDVCFREVEEQAFGQPQCRPCGKGIGCEQLGWPVLAQVDRNNDPLARRCGTCLIEDGLFVSEHLRMIKFVHDRSLRPLEPESPGVEPGSNEHHLANATTGRVQDESSKNRCRITKMAWLAG
jgi:hypothetical protein